MREKKYLKLSAIIPFIALVAALNFLSSCSDDEPEGGSESPYVTLEASKLIVGADGGNYYVGVESNSFWEASTNSSWLALGTMSTTGDLQLRIYAYPNTSTASRTGYIYFDCKGSSRVLIVEQSGSTNSGGGNEGGGNQGGNQGGGNQGGGNQGGGNQGGSSVQKPSAPTGVTVSNEGNAYIPDVRVRWNAVSGATSYSVYKSTSASGYYSKIDETPYAQYGISDPNPPTNGGSAYYKVKAVNSAGESDFSSYAKYTAATNDEAFSPAYTYGNCTVSGSTMTLRWTNSTGTGYGKATKVVLRVWNPYAEEWQDTDVAASATSASFNYSTKIDNSGYVKAGIVVSNAKGSFTAGAKVYDTKSNRWLN